MFQNYLGILNEHDMGEKQDMRKTIKTILLTLGLLTFTGFYANTAEAAVTVNGARYSDDMTELIEVTDKTVTTFEIPSSVTTVAPGAFNDCTNLNTLNIKCQAYFSGLGTNLNSLKTLTIPGGCSGNLLDNASKVTSVTLLAPVSSNLHISLAPYLTEIKFGPGAYFPTASTYWDGDQTRFLNDLPSLRSITMPSGIGYKYYRYPFMSRCNNVTIHYNSNEQVFLEGAKPYDSTCSNIVMVDSYVAPIELELYKQNAYKVGDEGQLVNYSGYGWDTINFTS